MTCRVEYNDNTSLQWSNPAQQTLFFGDKKGESHNEAGQRMNNTRRDMRTTHTLPFYLLFFCFSFCLLFKKVNPQK